MVRKMLMKICQQCNRRLRQGERCPCQNNRHKRYNGERRDKDKNQFYHSRQWAKLVDMVKARANGLDEYALSMGRLEVGNTVHHIYTIDERPDLKASIDNLIYVSARTHNKIHAEYNVDENAKKDMQARLIDVIHGRSSH